MNKYSEELAELLKKAYLGATIYQDTESMVRISRAVAAFKADPNLDSHSVFTKEFIKSFEGKIESPDKATPDLVELRRLKDGQWFSADWPPTLDSVYQRIAVSISGEPGSLLVQSLKDGERGLVHRDELVFPITKEYVDSLSLLMSSSTESRIQVKESDHIKYE